MHIFVVGGNGRTGSLVIDEALSRGHTITTLVRDPTKLPSKTGLRTIKGSPLELEDVKKALDITPPSVLIVTLNTQRTSDNPFAQPVSPPQLMTDSVANLITALKERDICKLVNLQAHGVGDSFSTLFFAMRWMVKKSNMSYSFKDHESAEQKIKASGLKYVLARPTRFTDGPAAPIKFYGNSGKGIGSFAGMSRKSAAVFLVDAAEKADWDETSPVMSN